MRLCALVLTAFSRAESDGQLVKLPRDLGCDPRDLWLHTRTRDCKRSRGTVQAEDGNVYEKRGNMCKWWLNCRGTLGEELMHEIMHEMSGLASFFFSSKLNSG